MAHLFYRDCIIERDVKPIPDRRHDWNWCHKDHDGPEDGRCGTGANVADCMEQIDEMLESG